MSATNPESTISKFFFVKMSLFIFNMLQIFFLNKYACSSLRPEGVENMSLGSQVSDLCF